MKKTLLKRVSTALAAFAVGFNLEAQILGSSSGPEPLSYYHPLTLAAAESKPAGGSGAGADTNKGEDQIGLSKEELAKMAQNPVANLMSFPFQNNFNFGVGPNHVCQYVLNFQPVIPITLNEDWNLITPWMLNPSPLATDY
jgi:hypothetical protein